MSRFFLVRHGETVWHAENRYAGISDIALTPKGFNQAEDLGAWAATNELTHIYVSPLSRARATAAIAEQTTGLTATIEPRIREVNFGAAEGLTSAEQRERFPQEHAAFINDPAVNPFPGGESGPAVVERARTALEEIAALQGPSARILVVAHNTMFRLLLCDLLGVPLGRYRTLFPSLRNGAVTELELQDSKFALYSFNVPLRNISSR